MKHTKEPWILDYGRIRDDNCNTICGFLGNWTDPQWQADRQRIVECVNALAGVADPVNALAAAREALGKIAYIPSVPFSRDRVEHASRTIEVMQEIAQKALEQL
jgi:hypothetical protein